MVFLFVILFKIRIFYGNLEPDQKYRSAVKLIFYHPA